MYISSGAPEGLDGGQNRLRVHEQQMDKRAKALQHSQNWCLSLLRSE